MRILFDHGTPRGIARSLQGHTVKETKAEGWDTFTNGELLKAAEDAGFDVLVTPDQNLPHQQNLAGRRIAVVVLDKANWRDTRPHWQGYGTSASRSPLVSIRRESGSCPRLSRPSRPLNQAALP